VRRIRAYCHPDVYDGVPSLLYHNNGDGTFTDVSKSSGIAAHVGKGLGVVAADFDGDSWIDISVANDSMRNFLFRNRGDGTFEEIGLAAGVAWMKAAARMPVNWCWVLKSGGITGLGNAGTEVSLTRFRPGDPRSAAESPRRAGR
jgi:hypothetical protein